MALGRGKRPNDEDATSTQKRRRTTTKITATKNSSCNTIKRKIIMYRLMIQVQSIMMILVRRVRKEEDRYLHQIAIEMKSPRQHPP